MMAADNSRARALGQFGGGEHTLPDLFPIGIRILSFQRDVALFGPDGVVFEPDGLSALVEEFLGAFL